MSAILDAPELTILTGGSGWFGRAYLSAIATATAVDGISLVARHGTVRVLVAEPPAVEAVLSVLPRAEIHVGDINDRAAVKRLFDDGRGASVVHAAAVIHPTRVAEFERVNTGGTATVLAAARDAGARRLVHVSSNSAFGVNPTTTDRFRHDEPYRPYLGYGRSKMLAEQQVRRAHHRDGLTTVVVRPPWFYGPWQPTRQTTFFRLVRTGRFPLLGDGAQRRSMVYVDNLVQGVALAERCQDAGGGAFWIADDEPYPMRDVLSAVRQALRDEGFQVAHHQLRLPKLAGRVAERVDRMLQSRDRYHQQLHVLGEMDKTIACDIARSREVLGYDPAVSLHEGMRRAVRWCVAQGVEI